jgi:osmotically-inducible protein OsmY
MNSDKPLRALALSAVLAALAPAYTPAATCEFESCASDAGITSQVQVHLQMHPALEAPNSIRVQTRNGVVYLYGHVDTEMQRDEAVSIAESTPDVRRVVATIRTTYAGG